MPVTSVSSWRLRDSYSQGHSAEMLLKNLAEQLLRDDELRVFKQTLQHFRVTRSVTQLCTSLRPFITSTERLMLLVELAQLLPTEALTRDFQRLCTLQFPKYHTFLRYFSPLPVTDGSKVVSQDASGQYVVTSKPFQKTPSMHGAESGFYSEHDDVIRRQHSRTYWAGTTPSASTLPRPSRPTPQPHPGWTASKKPSSAVLSYGPVKIVSGSFQSGDRKFQSGDRKFQSGDRKKRQTERVAVPGDGDVILKGGVRHQKRILLARRSDGSLGIGIKGGKEDTTPIVVYVVEEGSQAEQEGLRAGDRITNVNGTDFTNLTHGEAVTMMRNAWNILLTVESDSVMPAGKREAGSVGRADDEMEVTEHDLLVRPGASGRLGCAVHRDRDTSDILVTSVEANSPAAQAGLLPGDTIVQMEGMVVNELTEKQIAALTNSKRVRVRVRRKVQGDSYILRLRKGTTTSDEVFSPLDFSSPAEHSPSVDADTFHFDALSTPRKPSRSSSSSEEQRQRISATTTISGQDENENGNGTSPGSSSSWEGETGWDPQPHRLAGQPSSHGVQRIFRPRTMAVPSTGLSQARAQHNALNGHTDGGPAPVSAYTTSRGRSATRQPPPPHHRHHHHHHHHSQGSGPRHTVVYSARGRSADTGLHPECARPAVGQRGQRHGQASAARMTFLRNRSRSKEATLSLADRDLLQAVQSGVEKRQRALRLSLYQVPTEGDEDWKL